MNSLPRYSRLSTPVNGMTIVEVIVALMLFATFSAVFLIVSEFTTRYLGESDVSQADGGRQGFPIDQYRLLQAMDDIAEELSYPAVTRDKIVGIMTSPLKVCSLNPVIDWELTGPEVRLPFDYKICLKSTSLSEGLPEALALDTEAKPGIYVLLAVPEKITASARPVRRLFCRPKPYC